MGAQGTVTLDFGAFPGQSDVSAVITGQAGINSSSLVEAWIRAEDSADHSSDEHMLESIKIFAGKVVVGVGFTIFARNDSQIGERPAGFNSSQQDWTDGAGIGTRIYGVWNVAWVWN